jgi:hypothetical protein
MGNVVIGDPRVIDESTTVLHREVVAEKTPEGKETLRITIRAAGGCSGGKEQHAPPGQQLPDVPAQHTGSSGAPDVPAAPVGSSVAHSRSSRPSSRNGRRSRPGSKTLTRLLGRSPRQGRPFSSSCLNTSRRPLKPSGHHSSQGRPQGEATMPREKSRSFLPSRSAPPLRWYSSSHQKFKC